VQATDLSREDPEGSSLGADPDNECVPIEQPTVLAVLAIVGTLALWAAALALKRVDRRVLIRGIRNGALIGVVLMIGVALVVAFVLKASESSLFAHSDVAAVLGVGLLVGLMVAGAYLWIGTCLIALGLIFRAKAGWVTAGAWAAVPVIVVSAGFGYVSFKSVQAEASQPQNVTGAATLSLSGARLGDVSVQATATCELDRLGGVAVDASGTSPDNRTVDVSFSVDAGGGNASIQLNVGGVTAGPGKGWNPGPDTMVVQPGSSRSSGTVMLMNIVPLTAQSEPDPTERWSGQFSWTCNG
jgi:hypothetical protein